MANKYIVDLTLQRHLSALPKFVPVKSRVCGRQQSGAVVSYALVTLCAKKHVHILTIRPIHCPYREFQAVGRETHPTRAVAGFPAALLTKASTGIGGLPLRLS